MYSESLSTVGLFTIAKEGGSKIFEEDSRIQGRPKKLVIGCVDSSLPACNQWPAFFTISVQGDTPGCSQTLNSGANVKAVAGLNREFGNNLMCHPVSVWGMGNIGWLPA